MTTVGTFPVFLEWRMSSARQSARDVASRSSNSSPSARISSRASAQYGQLGLTYMIRDAMPGTLRGQATSGSARGVGVARRRAGVAVAVGLRRALVAAAALLALAARRRAARL